MFASLFGRFAAFGMVGGICTAVHFAILFAWVYLVGSPVAVGTFLGYGLSAVLNYLLNYHWTFASDGSHRDTAARFAVMVGFGLLLNSAIVAILADWLHVHFLIAQVVATLFTLLSNFAMSETWIFRRRNA